MIGKWLVVWKVGKCLGSGCGLGKQVSDWEVTGSWDVADGLGVTGVWKLVRVWETAGYLGNG